MPACRALMTPEPSPLMNLRTTIRFRTPSEKSATGAHRRPPVRARRPALFLGVAAAGALAVNVLAAGSPPAEAESQLESVSIAEQLGITEDSSASLSGDSVQPLEQLAASRAERDAAQTEAAAAQAAADQAELEAREALLASRAELERREAEAAAAREEMARQAAEAEAEAARAAEAAAAESAASTESAPAPAAAPSGSYQEYALAQLGGDANEFSCLENLWGKESGWNPDAQNPSSTAYGIPQFLDSTWAGTGIAKTSDGYRQIDAGLIYINNRYGSPCGAWAHSQANNWY
jgi:hypothetical protein